MRHIFTVGVIRVITISDAEKLALHGRIIERAIPQIKTVSRCIEDQPLGIYDEESKRIAIPKIVRLALRMVEEDKVDGIVVSCAEDPGVDEVRRRVKVPVVGAGSATAAVALAIGNRVGVLGITDEPPSPFIRILGSKLVGYARPKGVKTTLDIEKNIDAVIFAAEQLKNMGAEVIALACTGYSTAGIAPLLQEKIGIPVVDPLIASATVIYSEMIRAYRLKQVFE